MKTKFLLPILLLLTTIMVSCDPDDTDPPTGNGLDYRRGIWVVNEGQFLAGNASVSWFTSDGKTVKSDAFEEVNGRPLGDVAQSVKVIGSKAYVVVNNSGKIEVVNPLTLRSIATITGFTSPRFMEEVAANKAYVSDLFGGSITIVDLESNSISGSIPAAGWTEQILRIGDEAFVATADTNMVYVINTLTDAITDTIFVTKGVTGMVQDAAGDLWVLCNGGWNEYLPALYRIDPSTHSILSSYDFASVTEDPSDLVYDAANDDLLYLNGGVFRFDIGGGSLPATPLVASGAAYLYALALDEARGQLLVANAGDFVNPGSVLRFDASTGAAVDTFPAGVAPGDFLLPD